MSHGLFDRGLSVRGLRKLVPSDRRTVRQLWCEIWMNMTVAPGWTVEVVFADDGAWVMDLYTNTTGGDQLEKTPENSRTFVGPPGCTTLAELADPEDVGRPTHFLSFAWDMAFVDLVDALESGVASDAYIWMDLVSGTGIYHRPGSYESNTEFCFAIADAYQSCGHVLQACAEWNKPDRLKRVWLQAEVATAVAEKVPISLVMPPTQRALMADELRDHGPDIILRLVSEMETDLASLRGNASDVASLQAVIQSCWSSVGGREQMNVKLAEVTRLSYAKAISQELESRWATGVDADVLDLAHQLGRLWASANDLNEAEMGFRRVLKELRSLRPDEHPKAARADWTTAELVKLLRRTGRTEDAHEAECAISETSELAVSWDGISVEFVRRFVEGHSEAVNFLSTDAMVERIIKPASARRLLFEPVPAGRSLIEMAHDCFKGKPKYFVSHAWRQTFSVANREWRGGLAQALLHHAYTHGLDVASTHVWLDVFCVNQHLWSPHGGLLAFAFEPLRNAMLDCDEVLMFFETWDDPAPLSRVWCLDELRNALLLGKEVRVIMPPQALKSFRKQAEKDEQATRNDIARVVGRIDIEQASATFRGDRLYVLELVEKMLGANSLNEFCREIVRQALLQAAGLRDEGQSDQRWASLFTGLLEKAADCRSRQEIPQAIEIKRAVAMMRRRLSTSGSEEFVRGTDILREALQMARLYYGPQTQICEDMESQEFRGEDIVRKRQRI